MITDLYGVHGVVEIGHLELARLPFPLQKTRLDGILQDGVKAVQKYLTLGKRTRHPKQQKRKRFHRQLYVRLQWILGRKKQSASARRV